MQLEKLASNIAKRDKRSFEQLYRELSRIVYSVCIGIVRDRSIAEELTQDTFVSVWENISSYGGNGFKTWIISIARHKSLNFLRGAKRELSTDFTENEYIDDGYATDESSCTRNALDAALRILPDDEREIVLMRNSGLKAVEISEILGLPRGTVSWKYSQALDKMKKYLEEQ